MSLPALPFFITGHPVVEQISVEVFNLMNHANFTSPGALQGPAASAAISVFGSANSAISQTAGVIPSTTTTARQIQLALKLIF